MKEFRDIVHEYSSPLYWHIRRMVVSHEDAEDVLQETFVKAYRGLWTLRNQDALKTWLYKIATNEANRLLSGRKDGDDLCEKLMNVLESPDYADISCEAEIKLQKALLRLSRMERSVFCLKYYDEMDYKRIAKVCGSTEGSVKVLYHKAKDKIRETIK